MIPNTYINYEGKAQGIKRDVFARIRETLGLSWSQLGELVDREVKEIKKAKKPE